MVVVYGALLFSSQSSVRCSMKVPSEYGVKDFVDFTCLSSSLVKLSNGTGVLFTGSRFNLCSSSSSSSSRSLLVKASAQNPLKVNGYALCSEPKLETTSEDGDHEMLKVAQGKPINHDSPNSFVMILGPREDGEESIIASTLDKIFRGRFAEDELIFRQNFFIRSYDIDYEQKASFEALMNFSQEANISYMKSTGTMTSGFGVTQEMSRRDLIWVYSRMQVTVDCYPSWGDIVQAETWFSFVKSGIRFDCLLSDGKTGRMLVRTSSFVVMMNKHTRKLSKSMDAARAEMQHFCRTCDPILDKYCGKLQKLEEARADYIRKGLTSQWSDLDVNQHVNNVKLISWILEGTPASIRENHEVCEMTVEYRKECGVDSKLESLSAMTNDQGATCYNFDHLLRLENGAEIARGRTTWRPKGKRSSAASSPPRPGHDQ
ncbi:hypothetical protein Dimus_027785 [Dionaea muscipula]